MIPSDPIDALCFDTVTGRVRAYRPKAFRDLHDAAADIEFRIREGEMLIYDLYLAADGTKSKADYDKLEVVNTWPEKS